MHLDHRVPFLLVHVGEHAVAEDAGIVDENVELAEAIDRLLDHRLGPPSVADIMRIGDRLAAGLLDGVRHLACRRGIAASAVDAGTDVVDNDLRSMRREQQRMLASKSPSGSRDDGYPTFTQATHAVLLAANACRAAVWLAVGVAGKPPGGCLAHPIGSYFASAQALGMRYRLWRRPSMEHLM